MPALSPAQSDLSSAMPRVIHVASPSSRIPGAILFTLCLGMLLTGYVLKPDPLHTGVGTHRQLGLPSCGFLEITGKPCLTCGMTTSTSLMAHGHPIASLMNQPFGALLAFVAAMGAIIGGWSLYSGMSLAPIGETLGRRRVVVGLITLLIAAWGYKILIHPG